MHNSTLASRKYALVKQIDSTLWQGYIFPGEWAYVSDATSVDSCAQYCQMKSYGNTGNNDDLCAFFYSDLVSNPKRCYVGNWANVPGTTTLSGSRDVYFDPSKRYSSSIQLKLLHFI